MSTFAFKALDLTGAATRGEVEAEDKQSVAAQLRSKGLIVLDIEEQKPTDVGDLLGRFKKVKAHELTVATRQLSTMISSGMSLLRALYVLEDQAENDKLKECFLQVRKDVEAGISLFLYQVTVNSIQRTPPAKFGIGGRLRRPQLPLGVFHLFEEERFRALFDLPPEIGAPVLTPLGYPVEFPKGLPPAIAAARRPWRSLVHDDRWGNARVAAT